MPGIARVGDPALDPADVHPWFAAPCMGPFDAGSPNVMCNSRPVVRLGDGGLHAACPGTDQFSAISGATKTFANGKPIVRAGDSTSHCGGPGTVMPLTSPNTYA